MSRPTATVVVLAWNAWEATRACLDTLRPTLGPSDQVVVVDNGSRDATSEGLEHYGWVEVVTNAENRGFAAGCNQGAARSDREILVFLNNDTLTPPGWLDELTGAFSDPGIGAAGPRSNSVSGHQLVTATLPGSSGQPATIEQWMAFGKAFQAVNKGRFSDTTRLVGFCIAVRRKVFESIGGFDETFGTGGFEDDDLCLRIVNSGHRLAIAHGSFVYHEGHYTFDANGLDWLGEQSKAAARYMAKHRFSLEEVPPPGQSVPPLVSACLIVRDGGDVLEDCLSSLRGFVDEVVVYDTGSTDATREIARRHGAIVIDGYWDDDFARARNDSLARCTGDWILWIDADEHLVAEEPLRTRAKLWWFTRIARPDQVRLHGFSVRIENLLLEGEGAPATQHRAIRLFRGGQCVWKGRIHEQVTLSTPVEGVEEELNAADLDDLHIVHTGYLATDRRALRSKAMRNLRAAEAEAAGMDGSNSLETGDAGWVYSQLARSMWAAGNPIDALDSARQAVFLAVRPDALWAALSCATQISLFSGEVDEARGYFDRLDALLVGDPAGGEETGWLPHRLVRLLLELITTGDAELLPDDLRAAGLELSPAEARLLVAQSLNVPPECGDRLLEGCHGLWPGDLAVLACATRVAAGAGAERAAVWAERLQAASLAGEQAG